MRSYYSNSKQKYFKSFFTLTWLFLLFFAPKIGDAQQTILLKTCIDSAVANYPLVKQKALFAKQLETQYDQVNKKNLPQVQLNGKATYQNEVISLNLKIPGFDVPQLSKDQYRFSLDVQQSIYKGNITQKQKTLYNTQQDIALKQLEIELYQLKKNVVELFFGLMFNTQQTNIIKTYEKQLDQRLEEFQSLVNNGMILQSTLDGFKLEKIKLLQQLIEVKTDRIMLVKNLSELSGIALDTSMVFAADEYEMVNNKIQQRPEMQLMDLNQKQLEVGKTLVGSKYQPMVFAYGTAGYGRPGFNYLTDQFSDFYMVGIGFSWNIWSWQEGKREKQLLDINSKIIDTQKESFLKNLQVGLNTYEMEMKKQSDLIVQDKEIIEIQKRIAATSNQQIKNGVLTASQYITELEKVQQYELNYEIHQLKLKLAKVNYLWAMGIL